MGDTLLVADSFRMRVRANTAEVRGFSHHVRRFTRDVLRVAGDAISPANVHDLIASFRDGTLASGSGFPRLELRQCSDGRMRLTHQHRVLPPLGESLALEPVTDIKLKSPRIKGPNIERLRRLREDAGGEPLLCTADRTVIEGATTSILWWEGDIAHVVANADRVSSITEGLVVEILRESGTQVRASEVSADALPRYDVWVLNALHGIRSVSRIGDAPCSTIDPARLARVRAAYNDTWEPISIGSGPSA